MLCKLNSFITCGQIPSIVVLYLFMYKTFNTPSSLSWLMFALSCVWHSWILLIAFSILSIPLFVPSGILRCTTRELFSSGITRLYDRNTTSFINIYFPFLSPPTTQSQITNERNIMSKTPVYFISHGGVSIPCVVQKAKILLKRIL